jgi:hypothetical protein
MLFLYGSCLDISYHSTQSIENDTGSSGKMKEKSKTKVKQNIKEFCALDSASDQISEERKESNHCIEEQIQEDIPLTIAQWSPSKLKRSGLFFGFGVELFKWS